MSLQDDIDSILELIASLPAKDRKIIAIVGPPASGKTTLAENLVDQLNLERLGQAALVPMDGFHLDNEELDRLNLRSRKGAPQTFDAPGLLRLIQQLRNADSEIYYPRFDRSQDKTLPNAGVVGADTPLIVVEGNYLLLDQPVWRDLKNYFDTSVFLAPQLAVLEQRLHDRWIEHGFSDEEARRKTQDNDLVNARLVLNNSVPAEKVIQGE